MVPFNFCLGLVACEKQQWQWPRTSVRIEHWHVSVDQQLGKLPDSQCETFQEPCALQKVAMALGRKLMQP